MGFGTVEEPDYDESILDIVFELAFPILFMFLGIVMGLALSDYISL